MTELGAYVRCWLSLACGRTAWGMPALHWLCGDIAASRGGLLASPLDPLLMLNLWRSIVDTTDSQADTLGGIEWQVQRLADAATRIAEALEGLLADIDGGEAVGEVILLPEGGGEGGLS